ncbi:MAG: SagB/ThcOx family dehydrogenase [Desulfurococcales archaeon]|nr:SagB/ThcOx family dehydrogenase [Desulfurococcales archaeon]
MSQNIEKLVEELMESMLKSMSRKEAERLARGILLAVKHGDPALIYHSLSQLSRDYYGGRLRYKLPRGYSEYFKKYESREIALPRPAGNSGVDALQAILNRRSRREYTREPVSLGELSTILFYSVGVTGRAWWGGPKRSYPSAGALQPIEAYVVASNVDGLARGIYYYNALHHSLAVLREGDWAAELYRASLEQEHVLEASFNLILTAVYPRTASKYGHRSYRYIHWDAGFAGENVYIVVEALGLATTAVGAFYDEEICRILGIDCVNEIPMLIFPIGRRAS